jgi:hypothetical protein
MQIERLRSLIKESIQEYIKEIDEAAETAAMEARIAKCDEAILARETRLENLRNLEEAADMLDEVKVKAMENEIKELKKAKAKFEKDKEKKAAKKAGKGKKEVTTDAKTEDTPVDESDVMEKMEMEGEEPKEKALNESFLKMQKLAGVITEAQYNQKKKALTENQITNNPEFSKIEDKAYSFINSPEVTALLTKELNKLSPEEKTELSKNIMSEGGSDKSDFKSTIEKAMSAISLNEDMHDAIRKLGGYKPGQEPTVMDKAAGKVLQGLGVSNIMSMGTLPSLVAMAIDKGFDINLMKMVSDMLGSTQAAVGASVLGGLIGGAILWKIGKILQNEKTTMGTALFN